MSVIPLKADVHQRGLHVSLVPSVGIIALIAAALIMNYAPTANIRAKIEDIDDDHLRGCERRLH